jgi:2-desacetyl-2-hydroxyethyl bacteriochlorophyllide A dehydrogenase
VIRRALVFTGPRTVEVIEEALPPPPAGHVAVRTRLSAISAGTELLAYRGQLPPDMPLDETLPGLAGGSFAYPFRYGYAAVGEVAAVGAGVADDLVGRLVFAFQPHASAFVTAAAEAFVVPPALPAERAALLASMETGVNLVLDGAPRIGERVAVLGQGVVGLLTSALLARFPLQALVAVEAAPARARVAAALGATACASAAEARRILGPGGADLSYELTGNPEALDAAVQITGREGRVVVGSFYGGKRAPIDLGGHFHRGRLTLASSQVSHLAPALAARWDRARRMATAWRALADIDPAPLLTHRFPLARAADAYRLLDRGPGEALQVLLTHE